jgi:hypothetical protein
VNAIDFQPAPCEAGAAGPQATGIGGPTDLPETSLTCPDPDLPRRFASAKERNTNQIRSNQIR